MIPQYDLDGLGGEFKTTEEVERRLAAFLGVEHCILVGSGTAALFLALRATGATHVAIPCLTMFATAAAAELAGCRITFVANNELPPDVDTYLHVSLNGRDEGIEEVVATHPRITIIEDACQSLGSMYNGRYLGTFGAAGCYSFSPHKIISAGNGGCVVTNDEEIAQAVRRLKNFGRDAGGGDTHDRMGYNFKFTDLQAAFMLPQMEDLDRLLTRKREMYARYYDRLHAHMRPHDGTPWFVDLYAENRDKLAASLAEEGIGTRAMYPLLTDQRPFADSAVHGNMEQEAQYASRGLWLPSSLTLSDEEVDLIAQAVQERI